MSNNVRPIRPVSAADPRTSPIEEREPTPLQRAVLERAQAMRESKNSRAPVSPLRWIVAGVLAIVCSVGMYFVADVVLRKFQQITEAVMTRSQKQTASEPSAVQPPSQSMQPDQPYFIDLQKDAAASADAPSPPPSE